MPSLRKFPCLFTLVLTQASPDVLDELQSECDLPLLRPDPGKIAVEWTICDEECYRKELGVMHRNKFARSLWDRILQKGYIDAVWPDADFWDFVVDALGRKQGVPPRIGSKAYNFVAHTYQKVADLIKASSIGELYANKHLVDTVPLRYALRPINLSMSLVEDDESLLSSLVRLQPLTASGDSNSDCMKSLNGTSPHLPPCWSCGEFGSCAINKHGRLFLSSLRLHVDSTNVVAVTTALHRTRTTKSEFARARLKHLVLCILDRVDISELVCALESTFPSLHVLTMFGALGLPPRSCERKWESTLVGVQLAALPQPQLDDVAYQLPEIICSWKNLRFLQITGSISQLPACLRNAKYLLALHAEGCLFRGPDAIPQELAELTELRVFNAFMQGVKHVGCPPLDEPEREKCQLSVPFLIGDDDSLSWRCPQQGWRFDFGDPSHAYWGWKKIEKFHVDQNFVFGVVPDDIGYRWPHLRSFDLHGNDVKGKLPLSLTRLENLTQIQISYNDFVCGESDEEPQIIQKLYEMPSMRTLNVAQNPRLCGCRPESSTVETMIGGTRIAACDEGADGIGSSNRVEL
eukprot:TRINITY_DN54859_c0_g1_i1.p1 TRINITY_DN54859_c0_g1~~TRINITY_DN54859_c0_g1_i1.p1  ORF type:complete len:577 (-),score=57.69 TRINITY_DN54859_c0_g1_i1:500-2230(-)